MTTCGGSTAEISDKDEVLYDLLLDLREVIEEGVQDELPRKKFKATRITAPSPEKSVVNCSKGIKDVNDNLTSGMCKFKASSPEKSLKIVKTLNVAIDFTTFVGYMTPRKPRA